MPSDNPEQIGNTDSEDVMDLRRRIELYLKRAELSPTAFGRAALNDPRFVHDLRRGRELRAKTQKRIKSWLDKRDGAR